jgi:hypothetical protein
MRTWCAACQPTAKCSSVTSLLADRAELTLVKALRVLFYVKFEASTVLKQFSSRVRARVWSCAPFLGPGIA